jgi:hypothetical protein
MRRMLFSNNMKCNYQLSSYTDRDYQDPQYYPLTYSNPLPKADLRSTLDFHLILCSIESILEGKT